MTTTTTVSQISDSNIREALQKGQYIQVEKGQTPKFVQFAPVSTGERVVAEKDIHVAEPLQPDIIQEKQVNVQPPDEIEHEHITVHKAPPPRVIERTHVNVLPPVRKKRTFVTVSEPTRAVSPNHHVMLQPFEHEGQYYHYPITGPSNDVYHTVHGWAESHPEHSHLETPMLNSFVVIDPDNEYPPEGEFHVDPYHDHVHNYYD